MKISPSRPHHQTSGFSLVEAIFTLAIIGIMSSIIVAAISNASRDANRIVARQQQATLNSALNAWVMGALRIETGPDAGQVRSLEDVRAQYNASGTSLAKLLLISPELSEGYLDETTRDHFVEHSTNASRIESAALKSAGQHITLPAWQSGDSPKALLQDN